MSGTDFRSDDRPDRLTATVIGLILVAIGGLTLLGNLLQHLSALVWAGALGVMGAAVGALYLANRSRRWLLIPAYVMWAVAGLILLATYDLLRGEHIAAYVLVAIALPFLYGFAIRPRENWGLLIPAYVLGAIGWMLILMGGQQLQGEMIPTYALAAIALPFLIVFVRRPGKNWWALIPAYAMLAIGVMLWLLIVAETLDGLLIPAYVNLAIAAPFFVVFLARRENWWALIPGGILGVVGLSFLAFGGGGVGSLQAVIAGILILAGVILVIRQMMPAAPAPDEPVPQRGPEADKPREQV